MSEQPQAQSTATGLRLFRPGNRVFALGLAVSHLMTKPAFARLPFGDWSRILVGQINRDHYFFVADERQQIQGFAGWALATKENAEAWVEGRRGLSFEDSLEGDCLVINAWQANGPLARRFMVEEMRKIGRDKQTLYFKRHYPQGGVRAVRLNVNDFVAAHIQRSAGAATGDAPAGPRP